MTDDKFQILADGVKRAAQHSCIQCVKHEPEYCASCYRDIRKTLAQMDEDNWNLGILVIRLRRNIKRVLRLWRVVKGRVSG